MAVQTSFGPVIREPGEAYEEYKDARTIALDFETTGLHPQAAQVAVINMHVPGRTPSVLSIRNGAIPAAIIEMLKDPAREWVTHNGANFDLPFLHAAGCPPSGRHYDTLVGEQVLATHGRSNVPKHLGATMTRRLGRDHKGEISHESWRNQNLTEEQLDYAINDVIWLHEIKDQQQGLAEERRLHVAMSNEQTLTIPMAQIVSNGMSLPVDVLESARSEFLAEVVEARGRLKHMFGPRFNANSHKQVLEAMAVVWGDLPDTKAETLGDLEDETPWAKDILAVRRADKRAGFYDEDWAVEHIVNGRVFGKYWQTGADTTRMTGSDPNLQQIPRNMRRVFGNEPGLKVVAADYAQLEARVHAHLAQDTELFEALKGDIHRAMATAGFPGYEIDSEKRQMGKALTFTWLFGGGPDAIQASAKKYGVRTDKSVIVQMLANARRRFKKTADYHKYYGSRVQEFKSARRPMKIDLPWGHYRILLPNTGRLTQVLNTRVQGRAAIGLKEAILEAWRRGLLKYLGGLVHDEFVATSVPAEIAEDYGAELADAMRVGMEKVCDSLPIIVDVHINDSWVK